MQKKNAIVEPLNSIERVDDETGELITFSPDDENELLSIEQNITFNYIQLSLGLKTIRDRKLYLLRADSMKDYCQEFLRMSYSHMHRYLKIADAFTYKSLEKFSETPMRILLEISRDENLLEEANDPESDVNDIIKKAREQERKKLKKKMDEMEEVIDGKETLLEGLRDIVDRKDEEIARLKNALENIATKKGIDADQLVFVTQKQEALALIEESFTTILKHLGYMNNIPQELMDAELTTRLTFTVSAIKAGLHRIEDAFFHQIVSANDEIALIPEA